MAEQHSVFRKHPDTKCINAHLGWFGNDLSRLVGLFDELPNVYTELGAVLAELGRQPRFARVWMIQYQDRVMMGKDSYKKEEYYVYFRVLETADEYFDYYQKRHAHWKMYGLDLLDSVLRKVYYANALVVIPGLDVRLFELTEKLTYLRRMSENKRNLLHIGLFLLTIVTTTFVGAEWQWMRTVFYGEITMSWQDFINALSFSIPFLTILTFHEFGHYFTARHHGIKVSLPYYFPFWLGFIGVPSLGTMGAFIRIREAIKSRTHYFDVGVSGPLAGFVIALGVLWYGFASLPETEYIYEVHPEYELYGEDFEEDMVGVDRWVHLDELNPERYNYELIDSVHVGGSGGLYFGDNILMKLGRKYIAPKDRYIPSSKETMHYPWLLAGYLALFFTALNLLPIGQLDGGHVVYGLFGAVWHKRISTVLFTAFLFYAGLGWVQMDHMIGNSVEDTLGFLAQLGVYLYIIYICTYSMFPSKRDRWMYAAIMLAVQFFLSSFFGWQGYNGWILFGVLLGRFVGIQHPTATDDRPLTTNRKILGWIALIIFILCFSPQPMVIDL